MRKLLFSICTLFVLVSCTSVKTYNQEITKLHSVAELHEDIDNVYKQIKKHHPKLYQYTTKEVLDYKFDSLKSAITKPMKSHDFYEQLSQVVKYVRQGHLSLVPPHQRFTKKERKALKDKKLTFNTLDFEYLENKLWVKNAQGKDTTLIGSELIKINDETPQDLIEKYNNLITSDGYNTTLYNTFVGSRFVSYYAKDKGFVDSLSVSFKTKDSLFTRIFKREKTPKVSETDSLKNSIDSLGIKKNLIASKKLTKTEKKAKKLKDKEKRNYNKVHSYNSTKKNYARNFNFIGKDSTTAYMKIRGFRSGKYKPFYDETFATIDSLQTKNLIIDLRNNGGGSLAEIEYIYSFLTDENYIFINESEVNSRIPFLKSAMSNSNSISLKFFVGLISPGILVHNLIKTKKKDGKLYYKFKQSKEGEPKPNNYKGKIYVLINGNSFSAASILSTQLKANNRAIFVGEETGGAYNGTVAGVFKIYQLPNTKVKARIGLMQIETPFKVEPDGYGVKPDVEILPNLKDHQQNIDTELQWILNTIEAEKN